MKRKQGTSQTDANTLFHNIIAFAQTTLPKQGRKKLPGSNWASLPYSKVLGTACQESTLALRDHRVLEREPGTNTVKQY